MVNKSILIGRRLNELRTNAGESLELVGELVGVHKTTVMRWEQGDVDKIKLPIIEALALHYGVNPSWLLGNDVPKVLPSVQKQELRTKYENEVLSILDSLPEQAREIALEQLRSLSKISDKKDK